MNRNYLYVDRVAGGVRSHDDTFARQKVVAVHSGQGSKVCLLRFYSIFLILHSLSFCLSFNFHLGSSTSIIFL